MKTKPFNIVSLNDLHFPFESDEAVNLAIRFVRMIQPQIIILHEVHDFYALSAYDKDPKRLESLQDEIDEVEKFFYTLRHACPRSRIILLDSNHLDRLRRYLWQKAPVLASLRSLEVENLLCLDEYKIEFMESFEYKGILFKHGDVVRSRAGYTAKAEFDREGMSGVSGHTHRLSCYYDTKRSGNYVWIESGCLCDLNPEYIHGTANWQQGFSMITFPDDKKDFFHAQILPIFNGKLFYGGEIIT